MRKYLIHYEYRIGRERRFTWIFTFSENIEDLQKNWVTEKIAADQKGHTIEEIYKKPPQKIKQPTTKNKTHSQLSETRTLSQTGRS